MDHLTIENKSGKLKLNDIVMQPVMDEIIRQISKIFGANAAESGIYTGELTNCIENAADTLEIEIHSPGGSVLDGYVLYNEILNLRARGVYVTATINSLAASMASVIAMAADKIQMVPQGRMMIHDAQTGVRGNAEDLRKWADELEKTSDQIAQIYAERTKSNKDDIRKMMKSETWMTAQEAKSKGFIDEIISVKFDTTTKAMSILSKLFPGNDQIAQLEAQVAENETLRAELVQAQSKITELSGLSQVIAQKDSELAEITAKLTAAEATITTNQVAIADLTEKASVTPEIVSLQAAELLAATGHPEPVDLSGDTGEDKTQKTVTREQFNKMKPSQKMAFSKAGGKING